MKLLIILGIVVFLAYNSQKMSIKTNRKYWDGYLISLVIFLILLVGLRTHFNDTANYIKGFNNSETISEFMAQIENINLLNNPLFYGFQALVRTYTNNFSVFFMLCSIYVNILFVRFIKKHTDNDCFAFSMLIYVCLGTLILSMAAQKQILTMATLTLAIDALFDEKYMKYYVIVFIAGLIHTYAWLFLFLPLLGSKPWNGSTYLMLIATMFIMSYFQDAIQTFVEAADTIGKNIATEEVFDGNQMNVLRVAVYSVVPVTAFMFQGRLYNIMDRKHGIMIQMCTVSLMFMLMGTMNGANMFGRSANYFELGLIISLPWLINELFNRSSTLFVNFLAIACFIGFFLFDNQNFSWEYQYKSFFTFIKEIFIIAGVLL